MYSLTNQFVPPSQIYLNSKYADAFGGLASKKSHCFFNFFEPIAKIPQGYKYLISLNNAEIPNSLYNVNEKNNSITFFFGSDGSYYSINLTPGNYSADEIALLLSNIIGELESAAGNVAFKLNTTYDGNSNMFKFSITILNSSPGLTGYFGIDNTTANPIFGLSGKSVIQSLIPPVGETINLSSDSCVDVSGTRAVFFRLMNIHTAGFDSKSKISSNILARIPMNAEPNYIIYWTNNTLYKTIAQTKNLNILEIQITDSDGNLLDFNGVDWSCSIEINVLGTNSEIYLHDAQSDILKP